jgi:hypothetical protein
MITHFTSKAFVVYETYNFQWGVNIAILGVFNTKKRANAAIATQLKKYKKDDPYYKGNPYLKAAECTVNESASPFTQVCNHSE